MRNRIEFISYYRPRYEETKEMIIQLYRCIIDAPIDISMSTTLMFLKSHVTKDRERERSGLFVYIYTYICIRVRAAYSPSSLYIGKMRRDMWVEANATRERVNANKVSR